MVAAIAMLVGFAGFIGFGVAYWVEANTQWQAITLGVGLLALGFGVTAWGKYLMPQGPFVEERHEFHSTEAERDAMTAAITQRGGMVIKRRKMLGGLFALGSTAMGVVLLFPLLRSLGPKPSKSEDPTGQTDTSLFSTNWRNGSQLVAVDGREVTVDDLEVGGVLTVFPRGFIGSSPDQVILIRLSDTLQPLTSPGRTDWGVAGLRGLLQDVHPPRVPGRALPGADPTAGVSVSSVHLQRGGGSGTRVRTRPPPAAPAAHHGRLERVPPGQGQLQPGSGPRILGAAMIDETIDTSLRWVDDRLAVAKGGRTFLDKIFPDHWSFMLGEIALYSFVVLLATGVFLSLYYVPSAAQIVYHGSYIPLRGEKVSEAYASSVGLSFDVRSGLLMRQAHHWAADIFLGSIAVHMARVFFTGAFRKPREFNWIVGVTMLILGIVNGFLGYSLPDDLVSGTGIRIAYSIIESIPLVGSYLAFFVFGGNYPGNGVIIPRFFILHVLIVPLILIGLLAAHLGLLVKQKHTQFPGKGKTEHNVVGSPMFPTFMAKTTGFLFMVTAVIFLLGGFAQINPIWQFGQYQPYQISYAVQPDWYMGWLDGALRIMPSWEWVGWGHTIPLEVFLPAVIFPGIIFNILIVWPFIESRHTKDLAYHNLLDRPRDRPKRTAAGAAMLMLLGMTFFASSTDVMANFLQLPLKSVLWFFRFAVVIAPIIAYFVTYKICLEMRAAEGIGKRKRAVIVERSATGEYSTVESPPRPGDGIEELEAVPVPTYIDLEPPELATGEGVRRVMR